ncbi:hypothetical protein ACVWVY_004313 [Bradyrhizobium sp. URHC0002]
MEALRSRADVRQRAPCAGRPSPWGGRPTSIIKTSYDAALPSGATLPLINPWRNLPPGNRNSLRAYECTRRPVCRSRAAHRLLDRRQRRVGLGAAGPARLRHVGPPAAALAAERFRALAHQSAIAPTATKFRNAPKRRDVPIAEVRLPRSGPALTAYPARHKKCAPSRTVSRHVRHRLGPHRHR